MSLEKLPVRGVQSSYGSRGKLPVRPTSFVSNEIHKLRSPNFLSNQLINTYPTLRAAPFSGGDTNTYTAVNPSGVGAAIALDPDTVDLATGRAMAKVTIPATNVAYQSIDWFDNLTPWYMDPNDVWMMSVYLPERLSGGYNIQLLVTDEASMGGGNFRTITFTGDQLQQGYNLLTCLHVEELTGGTEYGVVKTTRRSAWSDSGTYNHTKAAKSLRFRIKLNSSQGTETIVYLGGIFTAPAGWAKGAVMWMADDVPDSFVDLCIPIIESFGWKTALAVTSTYASDPGTTYASIATIREQHARGHEIWSHLRRHEDMTAITTDEKTRALHNAAQFWKAVGIPSAAHFLAWPFGNFDAESITLAKAEDYKLGLSIYGDGINPLVAGCNPFYINRFSPEISNSWQVDTMINGCTLRGQGLLFYMHGAIAGGSDTNTYPGSTSFYVDHFKRWCDLTANLESQGKLVVTTPLEYLKLCGIDPYTDIFAE